MVHLSGYTDTYHNSIASVIAVGGINTLIRVLDHPDDYDDDDADDDDDDGVQMLMIS